MLRNILDYKIYILYDFTEFYYTFLYKVKYCFFIRNLFLILEETKSSSIFLFYNLYLGAPISWVVEWKNGENPKIPADGIFPEITAYFIDKYVQKIYNTINYSYRDSFLKIL